MNKLIVLLALMVVCIGCTNGIIYCYHCSNCPVPFNHRVSGVNVVSGHTGFCAKKSYSSAPSAPNSLGVADPGLCVVKGCRWVYESNGRQMYVCCCDSNYCNSSM